MIHRLSLPDRGWVWLVSSVLPLGLWSCTSLTSSIAPEPQLPEPQPSVAAGSSHRPLPSRTLYVNPTTGHDRATGQATDPFRTINQALQTAQAGTVIQLAPGTYSHTTGITFPLQLKAGVTLRGNPQSRGQETVIRGGGKFLSPSWAGQDVAIVLSGDSLLLGVTVTNSNPRGTAIWMESGTATIERNRLVGNNREGLFLAGDAAPNVRNNLFQDNGGQGISCTRDSRGVLTGNEIEANGFGVAIGDRSRPRLLDNRITDNLDGLVINGTAQPELMRNTVSRNQRDGIVVTNQAQVILQANTLAQNGQTDIHNTTNQPIRLLEMDVAKLKTQGPIN